MDRRAQLEEIDSLKSIYYSEEFLVNQNSDESGQIQADFWAFIELQDNYNIKYLENLDSAEPSFMNLKHLPPIQLQLTLPDDYPSKNPPSFLIYCQWLNKANISLLCKKLDEIWTENGCGEIIYAWCNFLKNDSLSYLGCENELDITDLCFKHLAFIQKLQRNPTHKIKSRKKETSISEINKSCETSANIEISKNGSQENGENSEFVNKNAPNTSAKLKVNSKVIKNIYSSYNKENFNFKKSKWNKNAEDKKYTHDKYDKRAVLNLSLKMSPLKVLENFNEEREKVEFLRNFYTCNICFNDKLGKDCTKFQDCNHVFCINCVRSYFTIKIKDGSVQSIKCPEDKCTTEALPSQIKEIVSDELFAKYDAVLLNKALDTLSDIIYCPRQVCQYPVSWNPEEKMASCPNCEYVFCVRCKMVYHGIEPCQYKPEKLQKLIEQYESASSEEKLQMENRYGKSHLETLMNNSKAETWIKDNSKACPKCNAAIEKSQGCNKMVCWLCRANFCWLCGALLDAKNPYFHYNDPHSLCANKLFHAVYDIDEDEDDEEWDWVGGSEDDFPDMDFYDVYDDDDEDDDDDGDDDDDDDEDDENNIRNVIF